MACCCSDAGSETGPEIAATCATLPTAPNASPPPQSTKNGRLLNITQTICRLALGALAAYVAFQRFAISFGVGATFGIGRGLHLAAKGIPIESGYLLPTCARGISEFLSGVKCGQMEATLGATAYFASHLRHDKEFFPSFFGLYMGYGAAMHCVGVWNLHLRISRVPK